MSDSRVNRYDWMKAIMYFMMLGVAVGATLLIVAVVRTPSSVSLVAGASTASVTAVATGAPNPAPAPGALSIPPAPGSFGVFDTNQSGNLPAYTKYLVAVLIFLVAALIEFFLLIIYGAFFVNDPNNKDQPLGLPPATVRVFLVTVIVLVIIAFALFPDVWGNNKAVVLLFGLLSTVIGFYFGSRAVADAQGAPDAVAARDVTTASAARPSAALPANNISATPQASALR